MKLLSTCTRFMFQSQTTRTFIWGRLLRPTNSLWLPLAGSMHSVPSIANRAPGNGSSVMLDFIHTCSSLGGNKSLHCIGDIAPLQLAPHACGTCLTPPPAEKHLPSPSPYRTSTGHHTPPRCRPLPRSVSSSYTTVGRVWSDLA